MGPMLLISRCRTHSLTSLRRCRPTPAQNPNRSVNGARLVLRKMAEWRKLEMPCPSTVTVTYCEAKWGAFLEWILVRDLYTLLSYAMSLNCHCDLLWGKMRRVSGVDLSLNQAPTRRPAIPASPIPWAVSWQLTTGDRTRSDSGLRDKHIVSWWPVLTSYMVQIGGKRSSPAGGGGGGGAESVKVGSGRVGRCIGLSDCFSRVSVSLFGAFLPLYHHIN